MESKENKKKTNSDFENNKNNQIKLEKFYQEYKNKILNSEQEKHLQNFQERISKLNQMEIKIARLEKFDNKSEEILQNHKLFVTTAKELLEETEKNLSDFNLRNILMLKYYLALKLISVCGKLNLKDEKIYFMEKLNDINVNDVVEKIKDEHREEIFKDEPLEGIFKHERKSKISLKIKLISLFAGVGIVLFSGTLYYFYHMKQRRNYPFSYFLELFKN